MPFADKLKSERIRLGLTQPECATILGANLRTYQTHESGANTPSYMHQQGALAILAKLHASERIDRHRQFSEESI